MGVGLGVVGEPVMEAGQAPYVGPVLRFAVHSPDICTAQGMR